MLRTTTPNRISPSIMDLAAFLVPTGVLTYVPVVPAGDAQFNECFAAAAKQAARFGGSVCQGWRIWEWPRVLIEAEFHAVWRDHTGELCDVTPPPDGETQILFLPDGARVYEGRQINNVRRPLSKHPDVAAFIAAGDAHFELMNRGDRARQNGAVTLEGAEIEEMSRILAAKTELTRRLRLGLPLPKRNEPCDCGSGKKFKRCCGQV